MPTINRLRSMRDFEHFLFSGVPEIPESKHERDFHTSAPFRTTGESLGFSHFNESSEKDIVIGYVDINIKTHDIYICELEDYNEE